MICKYTFAEFNEELAENPGASRIYYKIFSFAKQEILSKRVLRTKLSLERLCNKEGMQEDECKEIIDFLEQKKFLKIRKFKISKDIEFTPQKIPQCEKKYLSRYLKLNG